MKITFDQIQVAYEVASAVFDGTLSRADGVQRLHEDHDINAGSAGDFIEDFRRMMMGQEFHRTLSVEATDYFLGRIAKERDSAEFANAIAANYAHLNYYAKLAKGGPQHAKRRIVDAWAAKRSSPTDLGLMQAKFADAVERARADAPTIRQSRLLAAAKLPGKVQVVTEAYVRNPDVAAEVLERAKGICEQCAKPAPFVRHSNRTPYLEVHHRMKLADGGEDTVENAIALCPNCHREMHYGVRE
ncbi:HNH endonuclease [Paraburkholderia mimosarum]|uniref:HNH endonuclease n=1 Tax=Paraburkholderia mimosarum TaxID=312026 RepID=UPI000687D3B3|nr:HNH endonuclease signature motif containing protein [Paraburkholderia mimosarum]